MHADEAGPSLSSGPELRTGSKGGSYRGIAEAFILTLLPLHILIKHEIEKGTALCFTAG